MQCEYLFWVDVGERSCHDKNDGEETEMMTVYHFVYVDK